MLIFPKPFKIPALFLYGPFLEHCLVIYAFMPLGLFPGWGQRSLSRMMLTFKYLVKIYFDSFEVAALYLVGTFP